MSNIIMRNGKFYRDIGLFYISLGKGELNIEVNHKFNERLEFVIREHDIRKEDFYKGFHSAGFSEWISEKLAEKAMSCRFKANEIYGTTLYIIASVCNCSVDYLLGLSDCINPIG